MLTETMTDLEIAAYSRFCAAVAVDMSFDEPFLPIDATPPF